VKESKDYSERLTFDFNSIESNQYNTIVRELVNEFSLEPLSEKQNGLSETFQDFKSGQSVVSIEWDNWSGLSICSKSIESEGLARKLAEFVKGKYSK